MRPTAGDILAGRSRTSSIAGNSPCSAPSFGGPAQGPQITYFMTSESALESSSHQPQTLSRSTRSNKDSQYGIESFTESTTSSFENQSEDASKVEDKRPLRTESFKRHSSRGSRSSSGNITNHAPQASQVLTTDPGEPPSIQPSARRFSQSSISRPLTPLFLASPAPGSSAPGSPKSLAMRSLRHSDSDSAVDEGGSQAIMSSGEEDEEMPSEIQDSAPQLIMPSIKMPSRRPFTDRGKSMGRLKILIAGDSGTGKTSLIKSIVQTCMHIVHVDPVSSTPPHIQSPRVKKSKRQDHPADGKDYTSTRQITEVYASTKPYPPWWSDVEDVKLRRRRKSLGGTVLERNLCFVDTPGYKAEKSPHKNIESVIAYLESQFENLSLDCMNDGEILNLLGGSGGSLVDSVFYVIKEGVKPTDLEYMRRLAPLANIIPVLAKADELTEDQVSDFKSSISTDLQSANLSNIHPLIFPAHEKLDKVIVPFAVSSATSDDADIMDASLLMSPDYIQPLVASELTDLVEFLFKDDSIAQLRHTTAKKFVKWRKTNTSGSFAGHGVRSQSASAAAALTRNQLGSSASSAISSSSRPSPTSFALAKITDHTQREERYAQVRLAKWATDLQRSLQNEKERYETLAKGERALWLTERLGECVADGSLVPVRSCENKALVKTKDNGCIAGESGFQSMARVSQQDPLGIIKWNSHFKEKGWLALQFVGLFGSSAVFVWLIRNWGSAGELLRSWNLPWLNGAD